MSCRQKTEAGCSLHTYRDHNRMAGILQSGCFGSLPVGIATGPGRLRPPSGRRPATPAPSTRSPPDRGCCGAAGSRSATARLRLGRSTTARYLTSRQAISSAKWPCVAGAARARSHPWPLTPTFPAHPPTANDLRPCPILVLTSKPKSVQSRYIYICIFTIDYRTPQSSVPLIQFAMTPY